MLDQTAGKVGYPWDSSGRAVSSDRGHQAISFAMRRQRSLIALASLVVSVTDVLEMLWMSQILE